MTGVWGHVPEIVDGDAPHRSRGCDAQAWGVSELLRVWIKIEGLMSEARKQKTTIKQIKNN